MVDISFIILTRNSQELIERCLNTYSCSIDQAGFKAEFIVIDNASQDKTVEKVNRVFLLMPKSCTGYTIALPKNLGTTKSRNLGLKRATGRFCVICDSDTEFMSGDWRQAISYLEENKSVGIIAGHLYYKDKTTQHSVKRFPTLVDKLLKLRKYFLDMPESATDYYENFDWGKTKEVDTAISAFWLFRKDLLAQIGLLDEKIFYAPEDVDFCLRVWKSGKKIVYYPGLEILHKTQRISYAKPLSYIALSHIWGLFYYFNKHHYWFCRKTLYAKIQANSN
ncbi:MAG: glycosyltransferase [Actinomycetota bacterium]